MDESKTPTFCAEVLDEEAYKSLAGNMFVGGAISPMMSMATETGVTQLLMEASAPLSSEQVASQLRLKERYVREMLSCLAAVKLLQVEKGTGGKDEPAARFFLHPSHREIFHKNAIFSIYSTTGVSRFPAIRSCFSQDAPAYGLQYGQEEFSTWTHVNNFNKDFIIKAVLKTPGLKEQLESGIQALEIGCGTGNVMCQLAAMFPKSQFLLTDMTSEGMDQARDTVQKCGLTNVTFQSLNIYQVPEKMNGSFDWIITIDVIHDLPYPLEGLERIQNMLKPGGHYSMVDMYVSTHLSENVGNPAAAALYCFSTLFCIPESYQKADSKALGACWGKQQARELVEKAGLQVLDFFDTIPGSPGMFALCMVQKAG